jgi:hypothetical protein
MHVFETQAVGEAPVASWNSLREEVEKLQTHPQIQRVASTLGSADHSLDASDVKELLNALRGELLVGLLSVHCVLAAAADRWDSAREFLALIQQWGSERDLSQWARLWPISLRVRAAEVAPIDQGVALLTSLLRDIEDEERSAVIVATEGVISRTFRHVPAPLLTAHLDGLDELSRACAESWPINHWVAGLHFGEGQRQAGQQKFFAAAQQFARACACAPELAELRDWVLGQLQHLDMELREQIERELDSPEAQGLELRRLDSRRLSVAVRLGFAFDEDGAEAAGAWLAQAVDSGDLPPDSPKSLSGLRRVLGQGLDSAETWILNNVEPALDLPFGEGAARGAVGWRALLERRSGKKSTFLDSWKVNRWLTTKQDVPAKLIATFGAAALIAGISIGTHRSFNLRARDTAFAAAAEAWTVGDAADTRQNAREFLLLLPDDSRDARAAVAADRLRLSTLQSIATFENDVALARAKEDLTLASQWLGRGMNHTHLEN